MPGKNTHNNITNTTAKKKGQLSFTNSPMEQSMMEQTEYMATPTGGVNRPIAQVMTMTTPKNTKFTPSAFIMGTRIEVNNKIITVESMTVPNNKRNSKTMKVIIKGFSLNPKRY